MVKVLSSNGKTFSSELVELDNETLVTMAIGFLTKVKDFCDQMNEISAKAKLEVNKTKVEDYRLEWRKLKSMAKVAYVDYLKLKEEIGKREIVYEGPTLE